MNKNRYIWIFICFTGSVGIVLVLFALSNDMRRRPGNFLRQFPPHPALEGDVINLKHNSYYIAGATSHHVYLGNYTAPLHVLIIDVDKSDTVGVVLNVDGIQNQRFWSLDVKVDSPKFYLTDGVVPVIFQGDVSEWNAHKVASDPAYFQDFVPLTPQSFAIRAIGKPVRENILGKISLAPSSVKMRIGILEKQVDGIFCTEGSMHYNKSRKELVYLYLYRNEFIALDTNLNVLRKGHTIDTTTHANIRVETIRSTGETKFSVPQYVINPSCFSAGNLLFVNSALVARNESPKAMEHSTAIDVYYLDSGDYKLSFYIYDYDRKERMKGFQVRGNKLYALFAYHLQIWNLLPAFFAEADLE